MQWYYVRDNQRQGPVAQAEFDALVANGTITPATLVWREGMAEWKPYSDVVPGAPPPDDTAVCAVSGKRYPKREMIQYEGRWIAAEHRDTFFQQLREGVQPAGFSAAAAYGYGGFWIRFGARFIDGLILGVVNMVIGFFGAFLMRGAITPGTPPNLARFFVIEGAIFTVAGLFSLLYEVFFVWKYDATPGKMALGLKILRPDGSKLSVWRIVGRQLSRAISAMILYIGYIMAGLDEEKRALHDRICDTRVVRTRA